MSDLLATCAHCGRPRAKHWFSSGGSCERDGDATFQPENGRALADLFQPAESITLTPPEARALHMRVRGYTCDLSLLESAAVKLATIATQDGSRLHASGYWTFPIDQAPDDASEVHREDGPALRPHTIPGWWQVWSGSICIALLRPDDVAPIAMVTR